MLLEPFLPSNALTTLAVAVFGSPAFDPATCEQKGPPKLHGSRELYLHTVDTPLLPLTHLVGHDPGVLLSSVSF